MPTTGLEPVRRFRHWSLKPACLPIPARGLSQDQKRPDLSTVRPAEPGHHQSGVLGEGLEPSRGFPHRILNPARLPIPPPERPSGAEGSRTPDLLNAIQALSQLSYGPDTLNLTLVVQSAIKAGLTGLEPAASGVTDRHSNQTELQPLPTEYSLLPCPQGESNSPLHLERVVS